MAEAGWGMARLAVLAALASMACSLPYSVTAQVIQVEADGSVSRLTGPATFDPEGIQSLVPLAAPRAASARSGGTVAQAIEAAAATHALSPKLLEAVAWQESGFRQTAVSPKGARGVMQLMPDTAKALGVDASDLAENVSGGATYLAQMLARFDGDLVKGLAAYNAGPGAVARYGGIPPFAETQAYVAAILDRLATHSLNPPQEY